MIDNQGLSTDPHKPGRMAFICSYGRIQSYAPKDITGGITAEEAELVGWRKIQGKWICPFCSGNTKVLYKVFEEN